MLWNENEVKVKLRYVYQSFFHEEIVQNEGAVWELTFVYANPIASVRKNLWDKLNEINVVHSWLVIRDFNCMFRGAEWSSRRGASVCFCELS